MSRIRSMSFAAGVAPGSALSWANIDAGLVAAIDAFGAAAPATIADAGPTSLPVVVVASSSILLSCNVFPFGRQHRFDPDRILSVERAVTAIEYRHPVDLGRHQWRHVDTQDVADRHRHELAHRHRYVHEVRHQVDLRGLHLLRKN